jgi:GR25 family glycosyltransferase involved in LPS biosynthesis
MTKVIDVYVIVPRGVARNPSLIPSLESHAGFRVHLIDAYMTPNFEAVKQAGLVFDGKLFMIFSGRGLTSGEIGCAASHNVARKMIGDSGESGIIFEDDAVIPNLDELHLTILNFETSHKDPLAVLSLIEFRNNHSEVSTPRESSRPRVFMKLLGLPSLAAATYFRPVAAQQLYFSNQIIRWVSDWPNSKVSFYVTNLPVAIHPIGSKTSLIDPSNALARLENPRFFARLKKISNVLVRSAISGFNLELIERFWTYKLLLRIDQLRIKRNEYFVDSR